MHFANFAALAAALC